MEGEEIHNLGTGKNCGDFSRVANEFGDFQIPEGLKYGILQDSYNGLIDLNDNVILQNQFKTYLSSIFQTDVSGELRGEIITTLVSSLLNVWDENESPGEPSFIINLSDEEFMSQILTQAIQSYREKGGSVPQEGVFVIQGISYQYSDYTQQVFSGIGESEENDSSLLTSIFPPQRPNFHSEYIQASREFGINQYIELKNDGFSRAMRNFLQTDYVPRILGDDIHTTEDHLQRIQKFMCFLIDIETSGGTQLKNGVSTATGYTQTLNEAGANRQEGKFNSIDTRLRTALMFYNNDEITRGSRNDTLNIPETLVRAQWIGDLWEYNKVPRDMNTFSFDSELRLTLIYLATQNPDAMNLILTGNESEQATAARSLYSSHHTNVQENGNTHIVMMQKLLEHYS